jgi:hypothetical protein
MFVKRITYQKASKFRPIPFTFCYYDQILMDGHVACTEELRNLYSFISNIICKTDNLVYRWEEDNKRDLRDAVCEVIN